MSSRILISLAVAAALAAPIVAQADSNPGQPKGDWIWSASVSRRSTRTARTCRPPRLAPRPISSSTATSRRRSTVEYMLTDSPRHRTAGRVAVHAWHRPRSRRRATLDPRRQRRRAAADAEPRLALQPGRHVPSVYRRGRQLHDVLGRRNCRSAICPRSAAGTKLKLDDWIRLRRPGRRRHRFRANWFFNANVRYIDLSSDVSLDGPTR